MEVCLALRDAWFVNGMLFNSEVWSVYEENNVEELVVIDNLLERAPTGAGVPEDGQGVVPPVGRGGMFGLLDMSVLLSLEMELGDHLSDVLLQAAGAELMYIFRQQHTVNQNVTCLFRGCPSGLFFYSVTLKCR